jgi:putative transposase
MVKAAASAKLNALSPSYSGRMMMQLVEQHVIAPDDPRFAEIDAAAFASKNLYNLANYTVRQAYINEGRYIPFGPLYRLLKDSDAYHALPAKVAQWTLKQVDHDWQAFFAARRAWQEDPSKFQGRPGLPHYKDKQKGRCLLTYTVQAFGRQALRERGVIAPSGLSCTIPTAQRHVQQVRIVPHRTHYTVEVVYEVEPPAHKLPETWHAGLDLGVNNLAALASNKPGFRPVVVNGKPLKSINQLYNKRRSQLQSLLGEGHYHSARLDQMTDKRNRRIAQFLHTVSRRLIDLLAAEGIGVLVIGKNDEWKQDVNLGRRTNQNFVCIPHARFIEMLQYKAELAGIQVILTEESYTSKVSFLDREDLCHHAHYVGKRVKRGLFVAADGQRINADVNGAYNMIRKVAPSAFQQFQRGHGVGGIVVSPVRVTPREPRPKVKTAPAAFTGS